MTSESKNPESSASNEPEKKVEKKENVKKGEGETALDPNPAKALTELVTGSDNTTSTDKSSSKDA